MDSGARRTALFTLNKRLARYVKAGQYKKTMQLFQKMQRDGVLPNMYTFVPVLNACSSLRSLEEGRHIHAQIISGGCKTDVFVDNSLVDMYSKCGSIDDASRVFSKMPTRDVVSWNSMIMGYVKCGQGQKALELHEQMVLEKVDPDPVTFLGLLNACGIAGALGRGRLLHEQITRSGCQSNVLVASSLVGMYTKCGCVDDAWNVFRDMPKRDSVAWSTMVLGFVKCGEGKKALELSQQMCREGVQPSAVTFVGLLNACASVAALKEGRDIHKQIIQSGYESNVFVANGLVDMYAKCGSIEDARRVFSMMPTRNVVAWNSMLAGYSMHGHTNDAVQLFYEMSREAVQMNGITFVSLLAACSHGGLVDEGLNFFESMRLVYKVVPAAEHKVSVVDMLGRSGRLHQAEDLIRTTSCQPHVNECKALLSACRGHGNVEIGERVAKRVLRLDPRDASPYVLLSNMYAATGKLESSASYQ